MALFLEARFQKLNFYFYAKLIFFVVLLGKSIRGKGERRKLSQHSSSHQKVSAVVCVFPSSHQVLVIICREEKIKIKPSVAQDR